MEVIKLLIGNVGCCCRSCCCCCCCVAVFVVDIAVVVAAAVVVVDFDSFYSTAVKVPSVRQCLSLLSHFIFIQLDLNKF